MAEGSFIMTRSECLMYIYRIANIYSYATSTVNRKTPYPFACPSLARKNNLSGLMKLETQFLFEHKSQRIGSNQYIN